MKRLLLALILSAPPAMVGCGDGTPTKPKPNPNPGVVYPIRSTPKNAVLYLVVAFANRDSVATDSVYADDYEGTSTDMTDPGSVTLTFTKGDEVRAVGGLALDQHITFVEMDLKSLDSWNETHYANDPSDWVTVQIPHFKITVFASSGEGFVANSDASGETWIFEFTVKPTNGPSGTTYQVVRWVESRTQF